MSVDKSAFDFVQLVDEVRHINELDRLFLRHIEPMGAEYALGGVIFARGRIFRPNILIGSKEHPWYQYYSDRSLFRHDVIVPRICATTDVINWSSMMSEGGWTPEEAEVLNEPRNFGLADGIAIPLHGVDGELGTLTVAGEHFKPDPVIEAAIQMMAVKAYRRMIALLDEGPVLAVQPKLSKRQLQCLTLVRKGHTSRGIADNLGISVHTVKDHIERAMEIFDVGTRLEAVIAAERENLFSLTQARVHKR